MKVTIKPKKGKPIKKKFSDPKKAIAWINSTTANIAAQQKREPDVCWRCGKLWSEHRTNRVGHEVCP